jgi:hypothetical protein
VHSFAAAALLAAFPMPMPQMKSRLTATRRIFLKIWRQPILAGMSGEERVSVARRELIFELRLASAAFPRRADNQNKIIPTDGNSIRPRRARDNISLAGSLKRVLLQGNQPIIIRWPAFESCHSTFRPVVTTCQLVMDEQARRFQQRLLHVSA